MCYLLALGLFYHVFSVQLAMDFHLSALCLALVAVSVTVKFTLFLHFHLIGGDILFVQVPPLILFSGASALFGGKFLQRSSVIIFLSKKDLEISVDNKYPPV